VFTRDQALTAGLTEHGIAHRLEERRWFSLSPGVYTTSASLPTWERQLSAALLSRPGSIVAGPSAARLHHFHGFGEGRPVVMGPPATNARSTVARVIRVGDFDQVAAVEVGGFTATTVAETLWTLSSELPDEALSELVQQQVAMGRTSSEQLIDVLERIERSRRRGLRSFRQAVLAIDPTSESVAANVLEAILYQLLSSPGIPPVSRQHPMMLHEPARVDALIPAWSIVVEADGRIWHTRQADFQRDRERDNQLAARGVLVVRFTYEDLTRRFESCRRTLFDISRHRRAMNTV
jgi:very-short-patch-repair endonuclease